MWSSHAGVYEWLSLYCKPPEVMAAFRASLVPTHARQVIAETSHSSLMGLARPRHHGMFLQQLRRFDGSDVWAMILSSLLQARDRARCPRGHQATEYLQAAGRADAMTMEIRKRGGQDWGASWVRYVIGHPHRGPSVLDVAITLPRSTEMIARSEVFDADEAATLFDAYYQTEMSLPSTRFGRSRDTPKTTATSTRPRGDTCIGVPRHAGQSHTETRATFVCERLENASLAGTPVLSCSSLMRRYAPAAEEMQPTMRKTAPASMRRNRNSQIVAHTRRHGT